MADKPRNRIKAHVQVRAGDLVPHEGNWRVHTDEQRAALRKLYERVGFARSLLAYEVECDTCGGSGEVHSHNPLCWTCGGKGKRLKLIDGHLRQSLTPDEVVTVEVLDLTDEEARVMLAAVDPLAAMAQSNKEDLAELCRGLSLADAAFLAELNKLALGEAPVVAPVQLEPLPAVLSPPPAAPARTLEVICPGCAHEFDFEVPE